MNCAHSIFNIFSCSRCGSVTKFVKFDVECIDLILWPLLPLPFMRMKKFHHGNNRYWIGELKGNQLHIVKIGNEFLLLEQLNGVDSSIFSAIEKKQHFRKNTFQMSINGTSVLFTEILSSSDSFFFFRWSSIQYNTKQNKGISSSFVGVQIISAQTFATETHTHETKRRTTMKFETDWKNQVKMSWNNLFSWLNLVSVNKKHNVSPSK